jgi:hypothetical protein
MNPLAGTPMTGESLMDRKNVAIIKKLITTVFEDNVTAIDYSYTDADVAKENGWVVNPEEMLNDLTAAIEAIACWLKKLGENMNDPMAVLADMAHDGDWDEIDIANFVYSAL